MDVGGLSKLTAQSFILVVFVLEFMVSFRRVPFQETTQRKSILMRFNLFMCQSSSLQWEGRIISDINANPRKNVGTLDGIRTYKFLNYTY
jgi:hypothetical protein